MIESSYLRHLYRLSHPDAGHRPLRLSPHGKFIRLLPRWALSRALAGGTVCRRFRHEWLAAAFSCFW